MPILVRIAPRGDAILIEVIDHGAGIEAAVRRKLFSPFVSTKPGHTGLGLHVARAVAQKNGGWLEIVPAEAGGTVARLVLPRAGKVVDASEETD
jgi:signal transduction histidine kinase